MSLNRIVLIGRLTRDPEIRTTGNGKSVANFSIAVDRTFKPKDGGETCDFFNVQTWGASADFVGRFLSKGRLVSIDGRMQNRKYQAKDGSTKDTWEVIADNVQSLDKNPEGHSSASAPAAGGGTYVGQNSQEVQEYDPFEDS